jgi:hypothetical protein
MVRDYRSWSSKLIRDDQVTPAVDRITAPPVQQWHLYDDPRPMLAILRNQSGHNSLHRAIKAAQKFGGRHATQQRLAHAAFLRCLFGNPFAPVEIDPRWLEWNGQVVVRIAEELDQMTDCARFPLLADALEDAGCSSHELLYHLRGPGPHCRGCFAVTMLLGERPSLTSMVTRLRQGQSGKPSACD